MVGKKINAAFTADMIRAVFDCGKKYATRTKRMGNIGDWFVLTHPDTSEARSYEITEVKKKPLHYIAVYMYKEHGFISQEDFMNYWEKNNGKSNPDKVMYMHKLNGCAIGTNKIEIR